MHCVRLVEGTTVNTDAEVGAGCEGEAGAGPEKKQAHGTGNQGGEAECYGYNKQKILRGEDIMSAEGRVLRKKVLGAEC